MNFFKSIVKVALTAFIIAAIPASQVFADSSGIVQGDNVNVRADASTASTIITTVNNGQPLSIKGLAGDFYNIAFNGSNSYIAKQFVAVSKVEANVNDSGVNIRSTPSLTGDVVGKAYKNETYTVIDAKEDWYAIDFNGERAYINKDFLSGELLPLLTPAASQPEASKEAVPTEVALNKAPSPEPPAEIVSVETAPSIDGQLNTAIILEPQYTPLSVPVVTRGNAPAFAVVQSNDGLRLRSGASADSEVLAVLSYYSVADVIMPGVEWTKVDFNGSQGYVSTEFISLENEFPDVVSKAQQIVEYGKQFLGTPYSWAGTNLNRGVDCSGFVYSVIGHFGVYAGRSSRDMAGYGTKVDKSQLIPGDLVFFDTTNAKNRGYISHVGIYIGNGSFIHSSSSKRTWGVTISSLYEDYYVRTYVTARRLLS
ncbi:MAG: SH3 domain-containing protein [Clostridiales bacterium]|jgi:cell wall-associated NlpC family hydrolase|nr:SH3 domain-containing protein [Clostridiales bacterium]